MEDNFKDLLADNAEIIIDSLLENEILKEAVRLGREKKQISLEPLQGLEDFK